MTDQGRSLQRTANRWTFRGDIEAASPIRVGAGGAGTASVDQRVVRDADDRPIIPGTTIRGALRAGVDRLAPVVGKERGLWSCGLSPREEHCPTPLGSPAYQAVESALREFRGTPAEREAQLLGLLETRLCAACRLFGSPWLAGRLFVADAVPLTDAPVEFRDRLGVDRESGVGRDPLRQSYEAISATVRFRCQLDAENLDAADQALLALALSEWQRGALRFGGGGGYGLGDCRLTLERVATIDFGAATPEERRAYVVDGVMPEREAAAWLAQSLNWLFDSRNETARA